MGLDGLALKEVGERTSFTRGPGLWKAFPASRRSSSGFGGPAIMGFAPAAERQRRQRWNKLSSSAPDLSPAPWWYFFSLLCWHAFSVLRSFNRRRKHRNF